MANAKRNLVGAAAMAAVLFHGGRAMGQEREPRPVVLHIDNYAQVSSEILIDAEQRAASIYAAAGIRTIWIEGDSDAGSRDRSALHLRVLLLTPEMSHKKIEADHVAESTMGQALKATQRAYIFYSRLSDLASRKKCFVSDVLGRVIAHEVGHLLLTTGHSDRGIMQAELDVRPAMQLRFNAAQTADIRSELAATAAAN